MKEEGKIMGIYEKVDTAATHRNAAPEAGHASVNVENIASLGRSAQELPEMLFTACSRDMFRGAPFDISYTRGRNQVKLDLSNNKVWMCLKRTKHYLQQFGTAEQARAKYREIVGEFNEKGRGDRITVRKEGELITWSSSDVLVATEEDQVTEWLKKTLGDAYHDRIDTIVFPDGDEGEKEIGKYTIVTDSGVRNGEPFACCLADAIGAPGWGV
jgi:hypothetical protein